jgi:hypothetical protein
MFSSEIPVGHEGIAAKATAFVRAANVRYFPESTPKAFLLLQGGIQCDLIYICENLRRLRDPKREIR